MNNSNKSANLKEKLKQALTSTEKVISDDFEKYYKNNDSKKNLNFFEIDKLDTKSDFIKARAESDSAALKKKFSNSDIFKKNTPRNSSCKTLYIIAEKIRYESLGGNMLKGIKKNFENNYAEIINSKKKDKLINKEDVSVNEAFELYMIKNFHDVKLNPLTSKMLNFWENDFEKYIGEHIDFLKKNIENQDNYSSRFSRILQEMDIFQSEDQEDINEENQDNNNDNQTNENENSENNENKDKNKDQETDANLESDYEIDEYKLSEELIESDTDENLSENIIQQKNINNLILSTKFLQINMMR